MKLETPENNNYVATIVKLPETRFSLTNLDNIEGASIFGYQVLVGKGSPAGLGVFFPAETQLSDEFCYHNNLYRHADKNRFPDQKGYLEDNRRVRAIKFKGNVSIGLFMPLSSLAWTGIDVNDLREGDEFDKLNGKEICRKYQVKQKEGRAQQVVDRGFVRADKKFMPEHIDTEIFFKNWDKLNPEADVIITQKLHGTSIRVGNTLVNHKPTFVERIAQFFGAKIVKHEYAYLYGSRKVIKDANNPNQNHFYDVDMWSQEGKKLDGILPENYLLYGELVGWTSDGKEIQRDYTYGIPKGNCELYVYRIAIVNEKGLTTDLSWQQVKEFCEKNNLKYTPELAVVKAKTLFPDDKIVDGNPFVEIAKYMDARYFDGGYRQALTLGGNKDIVDEGICIRQEGLTPKIFKAKAPKFLEHETKLLDIGDEDLESSQS